LRLLDAIRTKEEYRPVSLRRRSMSVKTELEELLKWISELAEKQKEKPKEKEKPQLPREVWQAVDQDLQRASKRFAKAGTALGTKAREVVAPTDPREIVLAKVVRIKDPVVVRKHAAWSIAAEFSGDLANEAQALAFRAHQLSRRAPPGTTPKAEPAEPRPRPLHPTEAATTEAATDEPPDGVPAEVHEEDPRPPGALVKSAADTVEHAHQRLSKAVEFPDAATKEFEEELEMLADMTLSLRQQCKLLEQDEQKKKEGKKREEAPG
jgi:hypothetical protein